MIISLGDHCAAAIALRKLGLVAASMPFDWISVENGLCNGGSNGSNCCTLDFAEMVTKCKNVQSCATLAAQIVDNFWLPHDDMLSYEQKIERYTRRFERLFAALQSAEKIIWVVTTRFCLLDKSVLQVVRPQDELVVVSGVDQVIDFVSLPYDMTKFYQYDYEFWRLEIEAIFKRRFCKLTSYSQEGQDLFVAGWLASKNIYGGHVVEVGALNGLQISNSLWFEENGWPCMLVEPIATLAAQCRSNRPKAIVCECACSDVNGTAKFIEAGGEIAPISGLSATYDPRHEERLTKELAKTGDKRYEYDVCCKTLQSLLDEHGITKIDYLSIDVEGAELQVLQGLDLVRCRPAIIGFENNYSDTSVPIVKLLESKGYKRLNGYNGNVAPHVDIFMVPC